MSGGYLEPGLALEAGRAHGQLASRLAGGGLVLTAHKVVEDGARALLLIAPGLFRLDVRPVEDTLQVMTRSLHDLPGRWAPDENAMRDYGKRSDEVEVPYRMQWRYEQDLADGALVGRILVLTTLDRIARTRHFAAHCVLRTAVGAGRMARPRS